MNPHNLSSSDHVERRGDVRLASGRPIRAVVLDALERPVRVLDRALAVDVSAGGMALSCESGAELGRAIRVAVHGPDGSTALDLQTVAVGPADAEGRRTLRCRLTSGRIPAHLVYGW